MKTIYLFLLSLASLVLAGCATTGGQSGVTSATQAIRAVVPIGVEYAVMKKPEAIPYLRASADTIALAAAKQDFDVARLLTDINAIPNAEKYPEAKLAVMGGVAIYTSFFQPSVTSNADAVAVLNAISESILAGLPPNKPSAKRSLKR